MIEASFATRIMAAKTPADASTIGPPAKKTRRPERRGLVERLAAGETILCAEGYLMAFARNGYICHGVWAPEFIIEHPDRLRAMHEMFIHAGTDVTEAFQYYTHRKRMKLVGREDDVEKINRTALKIAREVAEESGTLFAGGLSNTDLLANKEYEGGDPVAAMRAMFEEQTRWAKEEGVDYMICETFSFYEEAKIALEVVKSFDLPAVVTFMTPNRVNADGLVMTFDGVPFPQACRQLLELGATLIGVNCCRGPETMLDVVEQIITEVPAEKVAALPVTFRTMKETPVWFDFEDKCCLENNPVYPSGLDPFYVSEAEIAKFTKRCVELGLRYFGLCCGNTGNYTRVMAETLGRTPEASKYRNKDVIAKADEQRKWVQMHQTD